MKNQSCLQGLAFGVINSQLPFPLKPDSSHACGKAHSVWACFSDLSWSYQLELKLDLLPGWAIASLGCSKNTANANSFICWTLPERTRKPGFWTSKYQRCLRCTWAPAMGKVTQERCWRPWPAWVFSRWGTAPQWRPQESQPFPFTVSQMPRHEYNIISQSQASRIASFPS